MEKSIFILGLIGGIIGILMGTVLVILGLNSKVTDIFGTQEILCGVVAVLSSIIGLIGGCINRKFMLIIAFILNLIAAFNLISNSSTGLYFSVEMVVTILFLVATILAFLNNKESKRAY